MRRKPPFKGTLPRLSGRQDSRCDASTASDTTNQQRKKPTKGLRPIATTLRAMSMFQAIQTPKSKGCTFIISILSRQRLARRYSANRPIYGIFEDREAIFRGSGSVPSYARAGGAAKRASGARSGGFSIQATGAVAENNFLIWFEGLRPPLVRCCRRDAKPPRLRFRRWPSRRVRAVGWKARGIVGGGGGAAISTPRCAPRRRSQRDLANQFVDDGLAKGFKILRHYDEGAGADDDIAFVIFG
jgi:hypothetical protein